MNGSKPYLAHLKSSADLITTYEATRAGFVTAALEKNRLGAPYVAEARTLKVKASTVNTPHDLLKLDDIRYGLLTAAGVSEKATKHLDEESRTLIIAEFIKNFLAPQGDKFVEELVYRFLLIRGDALGGKIRNLAGAWAQYRLTRYIISDLTISGRPFNWFDGNKWTSNVNDDDVEKIKGFNWQVRKQQRLLRFNVKVPLVRNEAEHDKDNKGKSVDICLFNSGILKTSEFKKLIISPEHYIALGELKGGIDPAGADEHWKTANSALQRIRESFQRLDCFPSILFVGGAIEASMSDEIWVSLRNRSITNAANLNDEKQMVSIASWLCNL